VARLVKKKRPKAAVAAKPKPRWPAAHRRLETLRPAVIAAGAGGQTLQLDELDTVALGVLRVQQPDDRTWLTVARGAWRREDVQALVEEQLVAISDQSRTGVIFTASAPEPLRDYFDRTKHDKQRSLRQLGHHPS